MRAAQCGFQQYMPGWMLHLACAVRSFFPLLREGKWWRVCISYWGEPSGGFKGGCKSFVAAKRVELTIIFWFALFEESQANRGAHVRTYVIISSWNPTLLLKIATHSHCCIHKQDQWRHHNCAIGTQLVMLQNKLHTDCLQLYMLSLYTTVSYKILVLFSALRCFTHDCSLHSFLPLSIPLGHMIYLLC